MHANISAINAAARAAGSHFEQAIGRSFAGYAKIGRAYLDFMPVPTRTVRGPGGKPMLIRQGSAPFDIYGYAPTDVGTLIEGQIDPRGIVTKLAVFIGVEVKTTKDHETSLPIVHPDSDSHGLEFHQLDALALVARIGGIARVVWDNGGAYGVLDEQQILTAHAIYEQSLATERSGKGKGPRGCRSIPWSAFKTIDYANVGGEVCIDWLNLEGGAK